MKGVWVTGDEGEQRRRDVAWTGEGGEGEGWWWWR